MSQGAATQARHLTPDWVGLRVTVTLGNGDSITGTLTGLNIETEALVRTFDGDIVTAATTVDAEFKAFGSVNLPALALVSQAAEQQ